MEFGVQALDALNTLLTIRLADSFLRIGAAKAVKFCVRNARMANRRHVHAQARSKDPSIFLSQGRFPAAGSIGGSVTTSGGDAKIGEFG